MNPQDLAEAHYRLAKTYVALEDRAKGREHLLYALEIAPHYREAQQLLIGDRTLSDADKPARDAKRRER